MEEKPETKKWSIYYLSPFLAGIFVISPIFAIGYAETVLSKSGNQIASTLGFIALISGFISLILSISSFFTIYYETGIWSLLILLIGSFINLSLVPNAPSNTTRAKVSRIKGSMRDVSVALCAFQFDQGQFPEWTIGKNSQNFGIKDAENFPSFLVQFYDNKTSPILTLTSPIAYLINYPIDPFSNNKNKTATFAYYVENDSFILYSCGPDQDYDIIVQKDFNNEKNITESNLINKTYDPTNGTFSNGDIYWLHWEE